MDDVTQRLSSVAGSTERDQAVAHVYQELLIIARAELARHQRGGTLNTRVLVNEAYLKLFAQHGKSFESRKHFFATAACAMRQIVVDHARAKLTELRGQGAVHTDLDGLDGQALSIETQAENLVHIDAALQRLAALDVRLVEVIELRFFAGLEVEEVAELLGVSAPTVKRDTRTAKAFLSRELASI